MGRARLPQRGFTLCLGGGIRFFFRVLPSVGRPLVVFFLAFFV